MDIPFELVLLEECQPFLEEFKKIYLSGTKIPLRRGMLIQPSEHITKIKVNKKGKANSTNERIGTACDEWFYKKFGIKARSQTVYCTGSRKVATDYGFPFFCFPVGKFDIIWSPKIDDLFLRITEIKVIEEAKGVTLSFEEAKAKIDDINFINDAELYKAIDSLLSKAQYVKGSLDKALASKNEIMIHCNHYYVARDDDPEVKEFLIQYIKGMF